jgi:hypothetical protein
MSVETVLRGHLAAAVAADGLVVEGLASRRFVFLVHRIYWYVWVVPVGVAEQSSTATASSA